jgi:hypothetical protein
VAATVTLENALDCEADDDVGTLAGSRLRGVVVAAAWTPRTWQMGRIAWPVWCWILWLRALRTAFPRVEEIDADAENFGEFRDGSADGKQLNGLGLVRSVLLRQIGVDVI